MNVFPLNELFTCSKVWSGKCYSMNGVPIKKLRRESGRQLCSGSTTRFLHRYLVFLDHLDPAERNHIRVLRATVEMATLEMATLEMNHEIELTNPQRLSSRWFHPLLETIPKVATVPTKDSFFVGEGDALIIWNRPILGNWMITIINCFDWSRSFIMQFGCVFYMHDVYKYLGVVYM